MDPADMEVDTATLNHEEGSSDNSPHRVQAPLVHIHFYDSGHAQGIYQLIEAYMVSLQTDPLSEDLKQQLTAVSRDVEEGDMEVDMPLAAPAEELEFRGQVEYFVDYCLDKYPVTYKTQVVFDQVYTEPFWIDRFVAKEEKRLRRMAIKCFNCGEDHHINQCTEPKDFARIQNEARLYRDSLGIIGSDKRYHLTACSDRFSKFRPGQISARLREALGIGPSSLPPYIPRMHLLGYPPGYRLQTEEHSLLLYHSPHTGDPPICEQGLKVIIYPGFNDHKIMQHAEPQQDIEPPPLFPPPSPRWVTEPPPEPPVPTREQRGVSGGGLEGADEGRMKKAKGTKKDERKLKGKKGVKGKKSSKRNQLEDDLGTLSDYELEELDGDDGEMVVGFCVKRTMVTPPDSPVPATKSKSFSLDFPPGLVDIEAKREPSSEKWNAIRKILRRDAEEMQN